MFARRDHFSDASQSSVETQIDLNTVLGGKLLESAYRFADLNAYTAKTSLWEGEEMLRESLHAHSPQELVVMSIFQAQASSRRAASYACNAAGITAGTQSELVGLLGVQIVEANTEVVRVRSRRFAQRAGRLQPPDPFDAAGFRSCECRHGASHASQPASPRYAGNQFHRRRQAIRAGRPACQSRLGQRGRRGG